MEALQDTNASRTKFLAIREHGVQRSDLPQRDPNGRSARLYNHMHLILGALMSQEYNHQNRTPFYNLVKGIP